VIDSVLHRLFDAPETRSAIAPYRSAYNFSAVSKGAPLPTEFSTTDPAVTRGAKRA